MAKQTEQFEKWLKTFYKNHRGDMRYEPSNKQGWIAALEWVKSRSEIGKSLYMINVNDIDEELGDGRN